VKELKQGKTVVLFCHRGTYAVIAFNDPAEKNKTESHTKVN